MLRYCERIIAVRLMVTVLGRPGNLVNILKTFEVVTLTRPRMVPAQADAHVSMVVVTPAT